MNWNVKLALWFTVVSTAARGVWAWVTLSLYLKSLTGSTFNVGLSEGIQGAVQALTAVVAGIYADRFRRDVGLRVAGVLGMLAIGATVAALMIPDEVLVGHPISPTNSSAGGGSHADNHASDMARATNIRYTMISTALGLWGMYQGVWNTVMETIFADSIKTGDRSEFNTRKFMLLQAASIVGPIVAVVIFSVTGNTWYHLTLRLVFVVGVLLCIPGALILFFFTDDEALGEESESHAISRSTSRRPDGSSDGSSTPDVGPGRDMSVSGQLDSVASSLAKYEGQATWCGMTAARIPHIIIASDLISGLASGMTIKFFPLYFAKEVYLRPVSVQTIYIALPFFMIVVSKTGQMVSKRLGRVTTSILMSYIGSAALIGLFAVEFYAQWGCYDCPQKHGTTHMQCTNTTANEKDGEPECMWTADHDSWTCEPIDCALRDKWYVALALYFFSTFQHCCRPLKKSILMDYTTKRTRGRWNSLDSVTRFGWSGSAVLGGYLIQNYSYGLTFLVTAFAQIVSATMLFALIPLMGSDHEKSVLSTSSSIQAGSDRRGRRKELAPLLTNEG